jgi:hypothetical protein
MHVRGLRKNALVALLAAGCAAVQPVPQAILDPCPTVASTSQAIAVVAGEPSPAEGVWLPIDLAASLACARTCCRDSQAQLAKQPREAMPWVAVAIGIVLGATVGVAVGATALRPAP